MESERIEEFSLFLLAVWTLKTSYLLINNIQLRVWFKSNNNNNNNFISIALLSYVQGALQSSLVYRFVDKLFTVIIKRETIGCKYFHC